MKLKYKQPVKGKTGRGQLQKPWPLWGWAYTWRTSVSANT